MPYRLRDEAMATQWRRQDITSSAPTSEESSTTTETETSTTTTTTTSTTSTETSTSTSSTTPPNDDDETETSTSTRRTSANTPTPSPSQTTSMVTQVVVITNNGVPVTTVFTTPTTLPAPGKSGSNNTGAIVGGVVGGIAAIGILILLFWLIRKRTRGIELDGNIFDPDRTAQQPGRFRGSLDLAEQQQMAAQPYNYQPASVAGGTSTSAATTAGVAGVGAAAAHNRMSSAFSDQSQHYQQGPSPGQLYSYPASQQPYGESPYPAVGGRPQSYVGSQPGGRASVDFSQSQHGYGPSTMADPRAYGTGAMSPTTMSGGPLSESGRSAGSTNAGIGAAFLGVPQRGGTGTGSHSSSHSTSKAAAAASGGLHLANVEDSSGPVVQHVDGGRIPQAQDQQQSEIPPAYDSIPRDEQPVAGGSGGGGGASGARAQAALPDKSPRPLGS